MRLALMALVTASSMAGELALYRRFGWKWWMYAVSIPANIILLAMWASKAADR
jgi:hypothetical protein